MKRGYSPFIILIVVAFISFMCSSCNDTKGNASLPETDIVYQATSVKKQNVKAELVLPGELEGFFETSIMAKVNGYVKKVYVDIGDRVVQGQKLAELEAPELKSQLDAAYSELQTKQAIYINTKGKFTRLQQTNRTPGAVSPYDLDLARTHVKSDSLAVVASNSNFQAIKSLADYLVITAPFDGIITERTVAPGAFVGPADKTVASLFRLKNESRLRLHVAVPEKYIAEINLGDNVKFKVKSYPDKIYNGKISRLARNLSMQTRSEIVEIEFDNSGYNLLPGMYANVTIPLKRNTASLVVPESAIVTNMERSFVVKVSGETKPVWVDVQKGETESGMTEVFGGLSQGDTILVTGSDEIKEKSILHIMMIDK